MALNGRGIVILTHDTVLSSVWGNGPSFSGLKENKNSLIRAQTLLGA